MRKKEVLKFISKICIIAFTISFMSIWPSSSMALAETDIETSEIEGIEDIIQREGTYDDYISQYANAAKPQTQIVIPVDQYSKTDMKIKVLNNHEGFTGKAILTEEEGYIEYKVNVAQAGLYNIYMDYYPVEGRGSSIERELIINGKAPFTDARHLTFSRVWADAEDIIRDNRDNDIRPRQEESPKWQSAWFSDYMGYHTEPYHFYFEQGENTIRLQSIREPVILGSLVLTQASQVPSYKEKLEEYKEKGYKEIGLDQAIIIQGEDAKFKSDPTLYPVNDRTSPATDPYHVSKVRMNAIGGYNWRMPGQWISWEIDAPESGLYQITIKGRQNVTRGLYANRKVYINGEVPFREMENVPFTYSTNWQNFTLGTEDEPYLFYLNKGKNELKMEVALGELAEILRAAEDSVYILNSAYRQILMITGRTPDKYRDYDLHKKLPGVITTFAEQSEHIYELSSKLEKYTGQRGSHNAILDRLAYQLADMAERPRTIQNRLQAFKDNVGALSTWILNTREQPLEVDYIIVASEDNELPKADVGFFRKAWHEFSAFLASFVEDYDSVGNVYDKDKAITVWITTGRDQANTVKRMIDDSFTSKTGIPVNVQLVQPQVLLPATVAGKGPDVALSIGNGEPVNYATRNASMDLTGFDGFDEVIKEFLPNSLVPFRFGDGLYGLPEQQQFQMMFYRTDILEELGLDVPQTWDDIIDILPDIQKRNMDISVPVTVNNDHWGAMQTFSTFLYQEGGVLYLDDGKESGFNTEEAMAAFKKWTDLYLNYSFPLQFDAMNRFRTGEMPIVINEYWLYNNLQVFAPEIRGLWEMAPIPGVRREDGSIDRSTTSGGNCVMMLKTARDPENAWEFMKWWVSADTQVRFGREMESLMGAAARHPTANIIAAEQLPWPIKDFKALNEQRQWVIGNPEVPGGYFTPRHLNNAFRKVVYEGDDHRETLLDYTRVINEEIDNKRTEFGLELRDGGK